MKKQWQYVGIMLDEKSVQKVKRLFGNIVPVFWHQSMDHVTLLFNDCTNECQARRSELDRLLGKEVSLMYDSVGFGENVSALRVILPDDVPCANETPHITLGYAPGAKPKDANLIDDWHRHIHPEVLTGLIQVVA